MKVSLVAQISIAESQVEVFRYLTDLKYHFLWNPHLQSISSRAVLKLGSSYKTTSFILGMKFHGTNKVVKLDPLKELELENKTGALKYNVHYQLHLRSRITVVRCKTTVESQKEAFVFTAPVLKMLARHELQSDLRSLKIAVEQHLR